MTQTVEQVLKQAVFYSDDLLYQVIQLPAQAIMAAAGVIAEVSEPFSALIVDKDEVTLVLPVDVLEEFAHRLPGHKPSPAPYRLLTLDVELEPTLVGLLARMSAALSAAGVSILPFAAYSRDHLLVPASQYEAARMTLETLRGH